MRILLSTALVLAAALPAFADETKGEIQAFDRFARIIVMKDKTVWQLAADTPAPEGLKAGDVVKIEYKTLGEDGLDKITSIEIVAK